MDDVGIVFGEASDDFTEVPAPPAAVVKLGMVHRGINLTEVECEILGIIGLMGCVTPAKITSHRGGGRAEIDAAIDRLEQLGIVERRPHLAGEGDAPVVLGDPFIADQFKDFIPRHAFLDSGREAGLKAHTPTLASRQAHISALGTAATARNMALFERRNRQVISWLQDEPLTAVEVAKRLELHPDHASGILKRLADQGRVTRSRPASNFRSGRPAWVYRAPAAGPEQIDGEA